MKETKKILCHFSFYDQVRIQDKLEEMAAQGWMIHQPGNFTWTFKKMEPQRLCFAVTYFPAASEFDPGPTEGELRKMDFCAHDGWQLAARWGVMQIFYNENENAVPIETDPVAQVANVKNAMKKNVLLTHILTAGLIVYYMVMHAFRGCSKLTTITIPNSVTSIGNIAFAWCESLTTVIFTGTTPPTCDSNAFTSTPTIYVPSGYNGTTFCGLTTTTDPPPF